MHCVEWVQRANMFSVPTDCPQRSERLGWMGDIQAFSQTAIFNRDMAGFFTKWVPDIRDSQADDGRYPDVAPQVADSNRGFSGVPAWGDAGIVVPWRMYQNYADTRMLEQHFESAKRWIDFIHRNNPNLLWQKNRGNDYNDWLNGDTLVAEGLSARHQRRAERGVRHRLLRPFDARSWRKWRSCSGEGTTPPSTASCSTASRRRFNRAYVDADGRVKGDTQAGYALALHFNLLDDVDPPEGDEHLIEAIKKYKDHPSTGIQTTHRMMLELSRNGRHDEAWRLLNLRTVPSWGYMVEMGATTIWERWDGYVKGRGFQDPGMNSFNHWAFGAVGEWVWRNWPASIPTTRSPAGSTSSIRPRPCDGLTWVKARYDSIRGPIVSEWKTADGRFQLQVEIPAEHDGHGFRAGERRRGGQRERQTRRRSPRREVAENGGRERPCLPWNPAAIV